MIITPETYRSNSKARQIADNLIAAYNLPIEDILQIKMLPTKAEITMTTHVKVVPHDQA